MITCTVGPKAVSGERCGKPAVTTFSGRDGRLYAECAEHFLPSRPVVSVGTRVAVYHVGVRKIGTVVKVGRSRCEVEVPVYRGVYNHRNKVISRPIAEVEIL